jgi:endonuclease/exonuclease/phosphatase (EEP) superfamily protein YafD
MRRAAWAPTRRRSSPSAATSPVSTPPRAGCATGANTATRSWRRARSQKWSTCRFPSRLVAKRAQSVAATHLQNRRGQVPRTEDEAQEQLDELHVVLDALARRPRPRALLGDLNMLPDVAEPVLAAAGYDVADSEPTIHARSPKFRIDYVAVDGFTIRRSEVFDTDVSDHRALVVEVVC